MTRSQFLRLVGMTPMIRQALHGAPPQSAEAAIVPMLYGVPREDTDLDAWFQAMRRWGVRQWMSFCVAYRPHDGKASPQVPFIGGRTPEFKPYLDQKILLPQEDALRKAAKLSADNGMEFWCMLPFPSFPVQTASVAEKALPDLFPSGKLNLRSPRLAELLKLEVRGLKEGLPSLRGINLWIAEGAGGLELTREDVRRNQEWEPPLVQAFDEITRDLHIEGTFFAHHYLHTVRSRRAGYEAMADHPRLALMEDITWPEEDMLHPFLGYLPPPDRQLLFESNPVALNFLLDTEYIGEGVLPSVYPRWWKHNVSESVRAGTHVAMGRVFFWDLGRSDVNFNRLNAQIFARLCYQPAADPHALLSEAAREMFGPRIPDALVDILWETEPVMKKIIGINGVDSFSHSRFPSPEYLDVLYTPNTNSMKAVDDLFEPPGTRLYPPLSDALDNFKQWRWQNRTVSLPAEAYLAEKRQAIEWLEAVLPDVSKLSAGLAPPHRDLFSRGYQAMLVLARGMELFVETASLHHQWARDKTLDDRAARDVFGDLAQRWRTLAATAPETPFEYRTRMSAMADFLEKKLPRLSI